MAKWICAPILFCFFVVTVLAVEPAKQETPTAPNEKTALANPHEETAKELLRLHNAARKKAGKPALRLNARLSSAAQRFAEFLAKSRKYEHDADGRTPAERIDAEGYEWSSWSENIAWGTREPAEVMKTWINSKEHRVNILGDEKEVGFGICEDVWVADFATQLKVASKKDE